MRRKLDTWTVFAGPCCDFMLAYILASDHSEASRKAMTEYGRGCVVRKGLFQ